MKRFWLNVILVLCALWIVMGLVICDSIYKETEAFEPLDLKIEVVGFFPTDKDITVVIRQEVLATSIKQTIGTETKIFKRRYVAFIDTNGVAKIKLEETIQGRYIPAKTTKEQYVFPQPAVVDTTKKE